MNTNLYVIHFKIKDKMNNDIGEGNTETRLEEDCDGIYKQWHDMTLAECRKNFPSASFLVVVGMFKI